MSFTEDSRVKIPGILHLCRLGYEYISLKDTNLNIDTNTNIFKDIFNNSIKKINQDISEKELKKTYEEITLCLENDDLGKKFYEMLVSPQKIKLIDFENFEKNNFNVVTELTFKNDDDEFRPDLTILINGMPLAIVEVKKPNNRQGILAERKRMNTRFQNKKFKKFINIFQMLVFSNNMNYDDTSGEAIQGAFYSTTSYDNLKFNFFRDENISEIELNTFDEKLENFILLDNNLLSIKDSPEFLINKDPSSPTNSIISSLFSKKRLSFFIKYGIVYVNGFNGIQKHIMRYPQLFASLSIAKNLDKDIKKGIIWHTQGSGKTALSYFNVNLITDYYKKRNIVAKFYFIVDRIDLLQQAIKEFSSRGLVVNTVNSKNELLDDFKKLQAVNNLRGEREITVVNIQKFENEDDIIKESDYNINTQRIYFLDEVHRSYDPRGSFLSNLINSDRSAVLIGLTGTPLIKKDRKTRDIFGNYFHKYYYNDSIKDGYTLRLIREDIENNYRVKLEEILRANKIAKGTLDKKKLFSEGPYLNTLLDYIIEDVQLSRIKLGDKSFGSMVVCDSADQAKNLYTRFTEKYANTFPKEKNIQSALIVHDHGNKEEREIEIEKFKKGEIDILFVYQMLLTGFDSPRLKKLYVNRIIKDHNLLQMLTRVNRPYKNFKYGYVVDFPDITQEFDKANSAYMNELQTELGNEIETFSNLFLSQDEIEKEIIDIKEQLLYYDLDNRENFSKQINEINDRETIIKIKKSLENCKNLHNSIKISGHFDLIKKLDFLKLAQLYNEVSGRLDLLNLRESLNNHSDTTDLLNIAFENLIFDFKKVGENELLIYDKLRTKLSEAQNLLSYNFDKKDQDYINLYEELKRLLKSKKLEEIDQKSILENTKILDDIINKSKKVNQKNNLLKDKYNKDIKYVRLHKRLIDQLGSIQKESQIFETLNIFKNKLDQKIIDNNKLIANEGYFDKLSMQILYKTIDENNLNLETATVDKLNKDIVNEYLNEYQGNLI